MSEPYDTLVELLEPPEMFVVCAARVHRSLHEGTAPAHSCLCRMFRAAEIPGAVAPFAMFLAALTCDRARRFLVEERCSCTLGTSELHLLRAIARWQRSPDEEPERALDFIETPAVRRIAAPAGRTFALEMAAVGLWVRASETWAAELASSVHPVGEGVALGPRFVH